MKNKTLRTMLRVMANNRPYVLGDDFYVSIRNEEERTFRIDVYHCVPYSDFLPQGLVSLCLSYASAFHLSMTVRSVENNPVICLTQYLSV